VWVYVGGRASSDRPRPHDRDHAWGQLTADAIRRAAQADAALVNSGTFRADLKEGPLTLANLHELVPFDDKWVVRDMTGSVLRQVLARSYERRGSGAFLQVSGLKVKGEKEGPLGITVGGEPLEGRRTYRVAMNDFLADGGDGYDMLRRLKTSQETGTSIRDLILDALKEKGRLSSGDVEKRWDLRK
jgi:2',3'-cyclic-nucleotide 2'-phosphodiesterase (5'-nucleotidase family)